MTLREQIRIEIIKWLGSRYTVTPYMTELIRPNLPMARATIDQNKVEELVKTLDGLFTPSESTETVVNFGKYGGCSFDRDKFTISLYHLVNILSAMKKAKINSGDWAGEIPILMQKYMEANNLTQISSNTEAFTLDEIKNFGEWYKTEVRELPMNPEPYAEATIKVNGRDIELPKGKITYDNIVDMAGGKPGVLYTITYSKAFDNHKHEGTIVPGEELLISDGTRISCYHTGAA